MTRKESLSVHSGAWVCSWVVALAIFGDPVLTTAAFVVGWFAWGEIKAIVVKIQESGKTIR